MNVWQKDYIYHSMKAQAMIIGALVAVSAACPPKQTVFSADASGSDAFVRDTASSIRDAARAETSSSDRPRADRPRDDGTPMDRARPDQTTPDQAAVDRTVPDQAAADQATPDQAAGDAGSGRDLGASLDAGGSDASACTCADQLPCFAGRCDLPRVHNLSATRDARVAALVEQALLGLGFAGGEPGPQRQDRVFVGQRIMVWIDQTGFFGKPNGLWRLNGQTGDALDLSLRDALGRAVNFLSPGENGDGQWLAGYPGAEHIEFPNRVPEADDDPGCAQRDWCNQYGVNEAPHITDPDIPWWSSCNVGTPSWLQVHEPVELVESASGLRIVFEAPLTKEADGDGRWDGDACHQDYLFADGVRRRVYLRLGLDLPATGAYIDRLVQVRNPAGNPDFNGPMSFIGGFVVTSWPSPHPLKRLQRYLRPEQRDVQDSMHGMTLSAGQWTAHPVESTAQDEVFAWLDQPMSLSAAPAFLAGRSATLAHVGPSDNADVGFCLCSVHGGLELGGGLLHGGLSLPVAGGARSIQSVRRLTLAGDAVELRQVKVYQAESDLQHGVGRAEADGWSAATALDVAGHLAYGPYARDWGGGTASVTFDLLIDNNSADNLVVATIDVYDVDLAQILASRDLRRQQFGQVNAYQRFAVQADLSMSAGHAMETRVYWHDVAYVRLDKVEAVTVE